MNEREFADKYCIFRCRSGSHAYGTSLSTSDIDTRGVFIAPPSHILSCIHTVEQIENKKEDITIFELRKFMNLAAQCNPNIIELLFTGDDNILFIDSAFHRIRNHRHLFLSKKAKYTFSGYAMSQLKRIKGHYKWIMKPQPEQHPQMGDYCRIVKADGVVTCDGTEIRRLAAKCFLAETFGITQFRIFQSPEFFADKLGFFTSDEMQVRSVNVHDDVLTERAKYIGFLIINLNEFKSDYREWRQYWEWKNNRNSIRAKLEEQHGFDTKHAMHLVRLMRMAQEILTEGKVIVRRPDAEELLQIRSGYFDYEWLLNWAEKTDKSLDKDYEASKLRFSADYEAIDNLYREIVLDYWRGHDLLG